MGQNKKLINFFGFAENVEEKSIAVLIARVSIYKNEKIKIR